MVLRRSGPVLVVLALLAACARPAAEPGPTSVPSGAGGELVASGLTLAGSPDGDPHFPPWQRWQTGADGAGNVWLRGPWQLVRVDPVTGAASTWDAAQDAAFAAVDSRLVPSGGAGVWLLEPGRARLFDGVRFARDLLIPTEMRNLPGGPEPDGYAVDLVEVGEDVWISILDTDRLDVDGMCCVADPGSATWVLRWSEGSWTTMSDPGEGIGGNLAVDARGGVWAAGPLLPEDQSLPVPAGSAVVHRWDGGAWVAPGAGQAAAPTEPGDVVADPAAGVWFVSWADGLRRFDGSTWQPAGGDTSPLFGGGWRQGNGQLAVSSEGEAWLAGSDALLRVPRAGEPAILGRGSGFSSLAGLAVAGTDVVVLDRVDVLRLVGERFEPLWAGSRAADWIASTRSLRAPSADEVWVWDADRWMGHRDGAWAPVGPQIGVFGPGTTATDGASWTITPDGLVRFAADGGRRLIAPEPEAGFESDVVAGPDGSVWVASGGEVRRYGADGAVASIGRPAEWPAACLAGAAPDGSAWAIRWNGPYPQPEEDTDEDPCSYPDPDLGWWDGARWTVVAAPASSGSLAELVGSDDGAAWIVFSGIEGGVARLEDGRWSTVATVAGFRDLVALPGGMVCGLGHTESITVGWISCYDPGGEVTSIDVRGLGVQDFAIAGDGAVWVRAPQVARLPEVVPIAG